MRDEEEQLTSASDRRELVKRASVMLREGPIGLRRAVEVSAGAKERSSESGEATARAGRS